MRIFTMCWWYADIIRLRTAILYYLVYYVNVLTTRFTQSKAGH